jgi:hypothetical protein
MVQIDKRKKSKLHQEIDAIALTNDGSITPEMIVEHAQIEGTALNEDFKKRDLFNPQKAMRYAHLIYARAILTQYKVWVSVEDKDPVRVRAMVSLTTDRGENGYRQLVNVLSDDEMRETLMSDAKKEMAWFKKKYAILTELAPVFTAIEAVS